jgi:secondary thiamine-phosphate synthase enzyme
MHICTVRSKGREAFIDVTSQVQEIVAASGIERGFCVLLVPHTTAAVTVNEGADPSVQADILACLAEQVPRQGPYRHSEGNSDAHIKSTLVGVSQVLPIEDGKVVLGTWQSIFFCEFDGPRTRRLNIQLVRDGAPPPPAGGKDRRQTP